MAEYSATEPAPDAPVEHRLRYAKARVFYLEREARRLQPIVLPTPEPYCQDLATLIRVADTLREAGTWDHSTSDDRFFLLIPPVMRLNGVRYGVPRRYMSLLFDRMLGPGPHLSFEVLDFKLNGWPEVEVCY